ncbi:MAG TPA: hypothetical protein VH744_12305 [Terriglobales bacterium]
MFAAIVSQGDICKLAATFAPFYEITAADAVVFSVRGLTGLIGSLEKIAAAIARRAVELGLNANIAIAENPDTALHAGRGIAGVTVILPGEEAAQLARLPINLLPLCPELFETLDGWGIHTYGDLAALPETALVERLGPQGAYLRDLTRGAVKRALRVAAPETSFEANQELEYPLELLEPLLFILSSLLNDLCSRLESHGLATVELCLELALDGEPPHQRVLRLPVAMRNSRTFLKLLQLDLEANPPVAPVLAAKVRFEPVDPRVVQCGLFVPLAPAPDKLEITLKRLERLVGSGAVGSPQLLDTHRPDAWRLTAPRWAGQKPQQMFKVCPTVGFRRFRPASRLRGKVETAAGPWVSSGDWWTRQAWAREEWDVALAGGGVYRIYREGGGDWFVEGCYD